MVAPFFPLPPVRIVAAFPLAMKDPKEEKVDDASIIYFIGNPANK